MSGWTYGGNAVEPAASSAYGIVEYAYYTDSDCTAKTTSDNSGASEEGGKPVNAGTYYVQASVAASVTYTGLISDAASFTIGKASLTITANANTITYGDAPSANGVTYSGFVNEESESTNGVLSGTLTYSYSYSQYGAVGEYTITPSGLSAANYEITYAAGKLTVEQRTAVLTWTTLAADELVYDGNEKTLTATVGNKAQENDEISVTVELTADCDNVNVTANGFSYTATGLTGAASGNYKLPDNTVSATYRITAAAVTITAADASKTYGEADPAFTVTVTGTATEADRTGLKVSYSRAEGENAGTYTITPSYTGNSNYSVEVVPATFTIYKKAVTVTADDKSSIYGSNLEELTFTVPEGALAGDDKGSDLCVNLTTTAAKGSAVGTYEIIGTSTSGNYEVTVEPAAYTIKKASLTITAKDNTITYGDAPSANGVSYSGFVNEESESTNGVLSGTLTYSYSYSKYGSVGEYVITPSGLSAANYEITYSDGKLTVEQQTAVLTWTTLDMSDLIYDGTAKTLSATVGNKAQENDEISVTVERTAGCDNVNVTTDGFSYTATGLTGAASGNYKLPDNTVSTTYQIVAAAVTITAADASKTYGDADPTLTGTVTGTATEADLAGLKVSYSRAEGENAGTYTITPSYTGNSNYSVEVVPATFTIYKKAVTVTADDKISVYGTALETLTFTIPQDALVAGDTEDDLAVILTKATVAEDVGTDETGSGDTDTDEGGTGGTGADDTDTDEGGTGESGSGDTDTDGNDMDGGVTDGTDAAGADLAGKDVGIYAITGTSTAANYEVTVIPATYTITKAALTITANDNTITYGDAPSDTGVSYSGFVYEESEDTDGVFEGELTYAFDYSQYGDVGTYSITPSGLTSANYEITYETGSLTVGQRIVELDWSTLAADELVYDGNAKTLTATVGNKAQENDDIAVTVERTADCDNVNVTADGFSYTATALTGAASGNYALPENTVSETHQITSAAVTVTANDVVRSYGDDNPTFAFTISAGALASGDTTDDLGVTLSTTADKNSAAGTYAITGTSTSVNYDVTVVSGTMTVAELTGLPEQTFPDTDAAHKIILQVGLSEVPEALKDNPNLNTVEKITAMLKTTVTKQSGYSEENVVVYDVTLMVSFDGGVTWEKATEESFPVNGLTLLLPYPDGTGKDTHDFAVTHMFTSAALGKTPGEMESPAVTKTADGLLVTVTGLSPIAVAWKLITQSSGETAPTTPETAATEAATPETTATEAATPETTATEAETKATEAETETTATESETETETATETEAPVQTGDDTPLSMWLTLFLLSAAVLLMMGERKRQRG
ncbi:MAG: hypothetical protein LUI13_13870 [Lachnospiraceae bacterium]|nr:hypothetical protein [Lachnospiraceae bacterium]